MKIPGGITLSAGHYWFSVRARMNMGTHGQWGWNSGTTLVNDSAHWRNPGAGFATTCNSNWNNIGVCLGATQKEFAYAMYGCVSKNAGTDQDTILCTNSGRVNLNTFLSSGTSTGGMWTDMTSTGALSGPYLTTGLLSVDTFTFRYSVGNYVCADTSYLTVYLIQGPRAGTGDTIEVCNTASPFSLYDAITTVYDTGGVFYDISGSAAITDSIFDPSIPASGLYQVWYYMPPTVNCLGDTAFLFVQVDVCSGLDFRQLNSISIYPNPVLETSSILLATIGSYTTVKLLDLSGKIHSSWRFDTSGVHELDLREIPSGYYLIEIQTSVGRRIFRIAKV